MSEQKNDGGPAFPSGQHEQQNGIWNDTLERGMSLREWFAGQEQLSDLDGEGVGISMTLAESLAGPRPTGKTMELVVWEATWRAKLRYIRADAMLKAREQ